MPSNGNGHSAPNGNGRLSGRPPRTGSANGGSAFPAIIAGGDQVPALIDETLAAAMHGGSDGASLRQPLPLVRKARLRCLPPFKATCST